MLQIKHDTHMRLSTHTIVAVFAGVREFWKVGPRRLKDRHTPLFRASPKEAMLPARKQTNKWTNGGGGSAEKIRPAKKVIKRD